MEDNFLLERLNLPMAFGVYFEDSQYGVVAPIGSSTRITENDHDRLTEDGLTRITE